ncbi:MAG: efflux RND transporter periplasmic adaptor subunit, partial [Deltaproteobacteria bacterium]|nr:efflux RND transporter periplasmic adaptor subunit [Deltaproteobacteria bacterium]
RTVYSVLLALLLTSVFALSASAAPPGPGGGPPPLVTVATVIEHDVNPPAEYVGHVEALQSVDLRARVEGFLEQVKFREGGDVNAGDLLYVIEQAPYQAKVDVDKAKIAQAEATLTKARTYLRRLVSAADIDNAVTDELHAKAQLQEAKADIELSELDFGYTVIRAPIKGRIGRTAFTKGNLVGPDSGSLARIVQMDPIRVVYSISENDLAAVRAALGDSSPDKKKYALVPRIKLPNGEILKTAGHVDFVDNTVDAKTGTIAIWAVFDNHDGLLLPGQYVSVMVSRSQGKQLPVVPQAAVQEDRDGRYVLVVDSENRVIQRRITTGPVVGTLWAVESGLVAGETVIVQGVQKVQPGQIVKTITEDEQNRR